MANGYEIQMYRDIMRIAHSMDRIADELTEIRQLLERSTITLPDVPPRPPETKP